jgi:hypothetical protein
LTLPDVILPGGAHIESDGTDAAAVDGSPIVFHADKAVGRAIERWRTKPAFIAWLRCYAEEAQELEEALWDAMVLRFPDYAFGSTLDMLGRIVGVGRDGRGDARYRARIKAQIRINQSFGTATDVIAVLRLIDGAAFRLEDLGTAFFRVVYEEPAAARAIQYEIPSIVFDAKAAAVGASVTQPMLTPGLLELPFRFCGDDADENALLLPGAGFGDDTGYIGGALSEYDRG